MSFLAPLMLLGAAAASIPVILHFFYRSRYRRVPWAAMKFLLTSIEQTSRRIRFQELLLLAVRTALLLLLALALARPSSVAASGSAGEAVDAVLIADTSISMDALEGASTRLERAKRAALAVIDGLPAHSTVQVIASGDRADVLGPAAASDRDRARKIVEGLRGSHLSTDFLPAVEAAAEILGRGQLPNKELYLFSDMQRLGWEAQGAALREKLGELARTAAVTLVRCGGRTPRNVSLVGITPQSGIPHTGERIGFAVLVRNAGDEAARDLTVTLEVDGEEKSRESQALPVLAPGETQAVTLTARVERAGLRVVSAAVGPDELAADNRMDRVLDVREEARALVVDGAPNETVPEKDAAFYLLHGLRPVPEAAWSGYHIQPRTVTPADASPALLSGMDLCILVNAAVQRPGGNDPEAVPPEFVDRLASFVREGGGLLIFAGSRVEADLYNEVFLDRLGLLPGRLHGTAAGTFQPDPARLDPASYLVPFREEPLNRIGLARMTSRLDVRADGVPGAEVAMAFDDGAPLVLTRRVGMGNVILAATSADREWTDWPLRDSFLPFLHVTLGRLLGGRTAAHNLTAGDPLRCPVPALKEGRVHFVSGPEGRRVRLGAPEVVEGQRIVTARRTGRAGVYRVFPEEGVEEEGLVFAVAPDGRETEDLTALTGGQIDEMLGFSPLKADATDDLTDLAASSRLKREWTLWILLAVLLLVLFEAGLAWWCGKGW